MRYLNKIIFLNSAHIPYAEVRLDGNVHFIGTQGVGKSTLLRALLFFYNADKLRLGIPKEKKSFDAFYFPYANSYIVYEIMRETIPYCVVALKSQGRVMHRFVDAPFNNKWFIDSHNQVYGEWTSIREQIGKNVQVSSLVTSYEMYRDIIFGNNRRQELLPYRKFAIVESAKYQNIPRTIQNVFLNTKLDADFIKNTIIRSMSDEDISIDLSFYREQIKEFEQEYKDVSLWSKKEKNGEVRIRRMADDVIDAYRALLNNRRMIRDGRKKLNFAENIAQEQQPQFVAEIQRLDEECSRCRKLLDEDKEKYDKECSMLNREIGALDAKLKETTERRKYYDALHIDDILRRVEQETIVEESLHRQERMKEELEKSSRNVIDKYNSLREQLDMDFRAFENDNNNLRNEHFSDLVKKKESEMQNVRFRESHLRSAYSEKIDAIEEVLKQLGKDENVLIVRKGQIANENPFSKEMETNAKEMRDCDVRKLTLKTSIGECEKDIERLHLEFEQESKIAELKHNGNLVEPKKLLADVDNEIREIQGLLGKCKGSFSEWLDNNKKGWQETIGKVVDEESVLYSDAVSPRLSSGDSLYGVTINLDAVDRKFRTPTELKQQLLEKESLRCEYVKQINDIQNKYADDRRILENKYRRLIKNQKDSLHGFKAELSQLPSLEKRIKAETLALESQLADWRKQQLEKLEERRDAIAVEKVKNGEERNRQKAELERELKSVQLDYDRFVKAENEALDAIVAAIYCQIEEKKQQVDARKRDLLHSQNDELKGLGMDTTAITRYNKCIAEIRDELAFIRKNRDVVTLYRKDKEELFDREDVVKQERKNKIDALSMLENKFTQHHNRLNVQLSQFTTQLTKQKNNLKKLEEGLSAVKDFRNSEIFNPAGSDEVEYKTTTQDCLAVVEELKSLIYSDGRMLDGFKKKSCLFLGMFSANNTFHFNVSSVTEEEFSEFANNLCEFVDNDKISEYQKRISGRYTDIIFRISKEVGDLTRRKGDINKTINDINRDFEERNFAGVIREIALRALETNDQLMLLLLRIRDFAEENKFNMGEMDLFSTESRQDVNAKAVKFLLDFMKGLLDNPNRKQVQVVDTFRLEFRIKENDNDTGWVEKIANVGSDGTDILVKAMVNIMLINVFKEKASKKSGDFKIHCMMDEIGKLHPNNVKGILDFANRRNILLVNSSPTTYNVEDYKYTYLLSKDSKANTKVTQLIKRL